MGNSPANPPKEGHVSTSPRKPRPDLRAVEAAGPVEILPGHTVAPAPSQPSSPPGTEPDRVPDARQGEADGEPDGRTAAPEPGQPAPVRRRAATKRAAARRARAKAADPDDNPVGALEAPAGASAQITAASMRPRHWLAIASFVLVVLLPLAATVGYLWTRAADQYHSEVAFSIRSEEAGSAAAGLIGAITNIGSGSASDADILFEYVRSQKIVEEIARDLDLRAIYNRPEGDLVFTLGENRSIEALVAHWGRMVDVSFESGAGIIHIRANAFAPEEARAITNAILEKSSALVNRLADQAREDAVRFAREELAEAEAALREMRQNLAEFRRRHRIVDPSADVAGQMGLLNALQAELAQALVERDTLLSYVGEGDQRVVQANRRITAISARIEEERASLGVRGAEEALPEVVGRYEELLVDLEFAQTAYTQALAALSAARAEARRQSRYLAPHIQPTLAESALYPRRLLLSGLSALFLMLGWGVLMLIYYNVRDNR
jgi:capsular polysaccharide transport system permease protein